MNKKTNGDMMPKEQRKNAMTETTEQAVERLAKQAIRMRFINGAWEDWHHEKDCEGK